jgi:integrase/recombinase XerD
MSEALARRSLVVLIEAHLRDLEARGYARLTVRDYAQQLERFRRWSEERGISRAAEVTPSVVEAYRRALYHYRKRDGQPLGWGSQSSRLAALRRLFAWLVKTGRLLSDPSTGLELPRGPRRLPKTVLSAEETERVLAEPDLSTPGGLRDRAILETLYSTGMRRSELSALEIRDVDTERGIVRIRLGKGAKDRLVPIGERAVRWTLRYLREARPHFVTEPDTGALFLSRWGTAMRPNSLTQMASAYLQDALGKEGACHVFRHTAATLMHDAGADIRYIQELLGHEDLSSTQLYTRVSIQRLKEVHTRTHPAGMLRRERVD